MQTGQITSNIADVRNDPHQQGKKANGSQASALAGGGQENVQVTATEDVMVTLSAGGLSAAATVQANIPAGNGNAQAVQQAQVNQNFEAAQAIRAYNNANRAEANNNNNMTQNPQQPPQQTQKTINRLGGAA